jgi:hypothetical protein
MSRQELQKASASGAPIQKVAKKSRRWSNWLILKNGMSTNK